MINGLASLLGILIGWVDRGLTWLLNAAKDRRMLSARTRRIMAEFFHDIDLDSVGIVEHARLVAPPEKHAMVHGHTIYWEGTFHDCSYDDEELLMHELVHVRQFEREGSTGFYADYGRWESGGGNWLEIEAEGFAFDNKSALYQNVRAECPNAVAPSPAPGGTPADFWIIWGPAM
jgi:hypothetical protein